MEHKFSSGSVLSQTFSVFFSNFSAFGLICFLILSPTLIVQGWIVFQQPEDPLEIQWGPFLVLFLFALLTPIATGALSYGVFQQVRGKRASVSDCLTVGFRRLLPVLGVGILAGLIQFLGTLLCIVPGFIAATILAAAVPAAVIERPGVTGALSRSEALTKGYRWTVFGVIFGLGILQFVANIVVAVLQAVSPYAWLAGIVLSSVIFTGLQATAPTLLYYHLRKAKESIDVEDIAAVFD